MTNEGKETDECGPCTFKTTGSCSELHQPPEKGTCCLERRRIQVRLVTDARKAVQKSKQKQSVA